MHNYDLWIAVARFDRHLMNARFCLFYTLNMYLEKIFYFSGDFSGEEIPDPIPNSEVKLARADGTCPVRGWESRSLPVFLCFKKS